MIMSYTFNSRPSVTKTGGRGRGRGRGSQSRTQSQTNSTSNTNRQTAMQDPAAGHVLGGSRPKVQNSGMEPDDVEHEGAGAGSPSRPSQQERMER